MKKQLAEMNMKERRKSANMQAVMIPHMPTPEGSHTPLTPNAISNANGIEAEDDVLEEEAEGGATTTVKGPLVLEM